MRNPVRDGNDPWMYESVWVDDNYAFANRTYILNASSDPASARIAGCETNCPSATIVKIGWVKAERQFDGLFRGGPDLRFARAEGIAGSGATMATVSFPQEVGYSLTRRDVRKKTWKQANLIWDLDWNTTKTEESMTVYDWDRRDTKKWSGSVKVSAGPVELSGSFEKDVTSKNELIKTMQMPRTAFFAANVVDLGHGTKDGFAIYHSDGVFFTIPIQIIQ